MMQICQILYCPLFRVSRDISRGHNCENYDRRLIYRTSSIYLKVWLIDWLTVYCFPSRSRIFHLYGDVTIAGKRLQNLGLCSALRAFEQRGIFIVSHLLWHGASVLPVSSKGPPHSIASYDIRGDVKDLFQPGPLRVWLKDTTSFLLLHVSRNSF
jgi:hypothetical protein